MVFLVWKLADELAHAVFGTADQPQGPFDKTVVVVPEQHVVSKTVVHVSCVEEACAAAVYWDVQSCRVWFVAQDGEDDGVGDSLLGGVREQEYLCVHNFKVGI